MTHGKEFKDKSNTFYRFTNERRSLRHSLKLNEETITEINRILSVQEKTENSEDKENNKQYIEGYSDLRIQLPHTKPISRTVSSFEGSPPRKPRLFDSTSSPSPMYHNNRKEKMTVFMSREHDVCFTAN